MSTLQKESTLSVAIVRSRGSKFFFELVPEIQPAVANGYRLVAIISEQNHEEAKDVSSKADYAALISQSHQPGAYFRIDGFYSVPELAFTM